MAGLTAELDALAGDDLSPLFGPALLDRLQDLLAAQNRLAAEVARTVRECEVSGAAEVDGWVFLRPDAAGAPADEIGRLVSGVGPRPGPADAVSLAWAIRRGGAAAAAVHDLGLKAAMLAG